MPPLAQNIQLYTLVAIGMFFTVITVVVPLALALYYFFQKFATKAELKAAEERAKESAAAGAAELIRVETHLREQIQLGRTENAGENASIAAKIDNLNTSVQLWVNENTRQTALMEGKVTIIEQISHQLKAPASHV